MCHHLLLFFFLDIGANLTGMNNKIGWFNYYKKWFFADGMYQGIYGSSKKHECK